TDVSYVPLAIRAGARVLISVRAERVIASGRRASGIRGRIVEPFIGREVADVHIEARTVVLAAGCMATPLIFERSGLCGKSGWRGAELQLHPGLAMMAIFPEPV